MIDIKFQELADITKQALSTEGVLGKHLDPFFEDIEKGGPEFILYAFERHIPVCCDYTPEGYFRAEHVLDNELYSFVEKSIAIPDILGSPVSSYEAKLLLGTELEAHDMGKIVLDDCTYQMYAAVYDLLACCLLTQILLVYFRYKEQGRDLCARRCEQVMDEQTLRFAKFLNDMTR